MAALPPPRDFDANRPFTYAAGIAAGITPGQLRGPTYRRLLYGVYVRSDAPRRPLEGIEAALLLHPSNAYASHASAARVYRAPLPERLTDEHVSVFHRRDRHAVRGVKVHLAPTVGAAGTLRGVRVCVPTQNFLELASLLDLVELVVVGDYYVRTKRTTPEALVAAAAAYTGPHAVLARRAAGYVRRGVDSPMETRLRMLIVLAGLPEPDVNHKIYSNGKLLYRFDLCYPGLKLIVEYDGRQHRDDLDQWDHDNDRDDWFDHNGWMIVKVFSRGIYKEPGKTIHRVRLALVARGCTTLPRRLREEWRTYFPVDGGTSPAP